MTTARPFHPPPARDEPTDLEFHAVGTIRLPDGLLHELDSWIDTAIAQHAKALEMPRVNSNSTFGEPTGNKSARDRSACRVRSCTVSMRLPKEFLSEAIVRALTDMVELGSLKVMRDENGLSVRFPISLFKDDPPVQIWFHADMNIDCNDFVPLEAQQTAK